MPDHLPQHLRLMADGLEGPSQNDDDVSALREAAAEIERLTAALEVTAFVLEDAATVIEPTNKELAAVWMGYVQKAKKTLNGALAHDAPPTATGEASGGSAGAGPRERNPAADFSASHEQKVEPAKEGT